MVLASILWVGPAAADAVADCDSGNPPARVIAGCTTLIERGIASDRNRSVAHYNRGRAYMIDGQYRAAVADFDRALEARPRNGDTHYMRGLAFSYLEERAAAEAAYTEAIRHDPANHWSWYNRGLTRFQRGNLDGALTDYNEALARNPRNPYAQQARGRVRCRMGDRAGAAEDYRAAAARGAIDVAPLQQMLATLGLYEGAVDGLYGPMTAGAIDAWAATGCPGA
ncbi:MAG: tetratricopeptide repeat protein [Pseudomonadota bacterium]